MAIQNKRVWFPWHEKTLLEMPSFILLCKLETDEPFFYKRKDKPQAAVNTRYHLTNIIIEAIIRLRIHMHG